jgi:hypothetical protein
LNIKSVITLYKFADKQQARKELMNLKQFVAALDDTQTYPDYVFLSLVILRVINDNDWYDAKKRLEMRRHFKAKRPEMFSAFEFLQFVLLHTTDKRFHVETRYASNGSIGGGSFYRHSEALNALEKLNDRPDVSHQILVDALDNVVELVKGDSVEPFQAGLDVNYPGWKLGKVQQ